MQRRVWIALGLVGLVVIGASAWVLVLWLRITSNPAYTTKQWAYITAHAPDPRVQPCFGQAGHTVTVVRHAHGNGTRVLVMRGTAREEDPSIFLKCMRTRLRGN
jgi:hypothetical protein